MTRISKCVLLFVFGILFIAGPTCRGLPLGATPAVAKKQMYTCGMHPFIIQDHPGLCPICGMELTPLKEGSGGKGGQVIKIDPVTSQKMGIRTAEAMLRPLVHTIRTVGLVDYEEPGQRSINAKVSGWVEALMVNQSGQEVAEGQPLLRIYSPDLVASQNELLLAMKNLEEEKNSGFPEAEKDARSLLAAARSRLELWDISPAQIKRLETTGKVEKSLTLYSPAAGVVSKKEVREGEYVPAGSELMEISSLQQVWVYADIYEDEIPWVKTGQQAEVKVPSMPKPISGKVTKLYPYLDATTRTVKARIELDNAGLELKPDMYADVTIHTMPTAGILAIPVEAVLFTGVKQTVFVALGDGKFEPREVTTGLQDETGYVQIISGLKPGQRVVTSAQFMLDSESKLREALQKMLAPDQPDSAQKQNPEDLF